MSCTYSLDHVSATTEDVSVEVAEKANMVHQRPTADPKTGEMGDTYVLATGDDAFPAYVSYRYRNEDRKTGRVRVITVTLSTWAVSEDSVTGVATRRPVWATQIYTLPADTTIEVADFDDLIGNSFSLLYPSVGSKVRDTTWLAKLLFGVTQVK